MDDIISLTQLQQAYKKLQLKLHNLEDEKERIERDILAPVLADIRLYDNQWQALKQMSLVMFGTPNPLNVRGDEKQASPAKEELTEADWANAIKTNQGDNEEYLVAHQKAVVELRSEGGTDDGQADPGS